jgi:hypothetical protein
VALEDVDVEQGIPITQARKLLSSILANGTVFFSTHAKQEMTKDNLTEDDVKNILRGGRIHEEPEWKDDSWRYRFHTNTCCAVVAFDSVTMSVVVTAWRK